VSLDFFGIEDRERGCATHNNLRQALCRNAGCASAASGLCIQVSDIAAETDAAGTSLQRHERYFAGEGSATAKGCAAAGRHTGCCGVINRALAVVRPNRMPARDGFLSRAVSPQWPVLLFRQDYHPIMLPPVAPLFIC
jgi:hypothetical protein